MTGTTTGLTREIYEAFQRVELDRWDAVVAEDVAINSPAGYGMRGLQLLKDWAGAFARFAKQIDLVDEHEAVDEQGTGAPSSRSTCIGSTLKSSWDWPRPVARARRWRRCL